MTTKHSAPAFHYLSPAVATVAPDGRREDLDAKHKAAVAFLRARGITDPRSVLRVKDSPQ